jgi:hypothetical protein
VFAQGVNAPPPGPFVIDLRGTTVGAPQESPYYPVVPLGTNVPARGFGLQAGGHVYPLAVGKHRVGFGVDVLVTRGTVTTPTVMTSTDTTGTATSTSGTTDVFPDVAVTTRIISPQVSLNFGSSRGWSYLTAGGGAARVSSSADGEDVVTNKTDVNVGAGARWFITDHVGVGFDLRAHRIGTETLFGASVGFSLK